MQPPVSTASHHLSLWPLCLLAFLVCGIAGSLFFVVFCSLQPTDLVAKDYYEQELTYQLHMQRIANTRSLAQGAAIGYDAARNKITISVPCPANACPPKGHIELYRPSEAGLDRQFKLNVDKAGLQELDTRTMLPGLWKVRLFWTATDTEFFLDKSIVINRGAS